MPIHEFLCPGCKAEFELLIRGDEETSCPKCGQTRLERQLSIISTPATAGNTRSPVESCDMPKCCGGGCRPM